MIASYAQLCTSLALLCKTFSANVAILFSVPRVMVAGQLSPSYRVSGPSRMLIPNQSPDDAVPRNTSRVVTLGSF